ncbi:MAG TPA: hypothetical protein VEH79_03270, partial [Gaiellaceae bacterium]|nr:hypothetical protein [Gaiellaceae bacterium]
MSGPSTDEKRSQSSSPDATRSMVSWCSKESSKASPSSVAAYLSSPQSNGLGRPSGGGGPKREETKQVRDGAVGSPGGERQPAARLRDARELTGDCCVVGSEHAPGDRRDDGERAVSMGHRLCVADVEADVEAARGGRSAC